jgi:hypothetical protein
MFMGNQYSITVSDESEAILRELKEKGWKISQMFDVAVKTLGAEALMRLHGIHRRSNQVIDDMLQEMNDEVSE